MDETLKGTVKHQLSLPKKRQPIRQITQSCILDHCEPDTDKPWRAALRIQKSVRGQYYRSITEHPGQALNFTYALNCPPSGFHVTPWTRPCLNHKVCPWCFARRLVKIYDALREPDPRIRNLHRLVAWQREVPATAELPFFRPDIGPHSWLNALVTVQLVVPFYHASTGIFRLRHIGIQLVLKENMDFAERLKRSCVNPSLSSFTYNTVTSSNIYKVFNTVMKFPWLDLYLSDNLEHFEKLTNIYPRQNLLRISQYKPKGT